MPERFHESFRKRFLRPVINNNDLIITFFNVFLVLRGKREQCPFRLSVHVVDHHYDRYGRTFSEKAFLSDDITLMVIVRGILPDNL